MYDAIPMADSLATVLTNTENIADVSTLSSACNIGSWWSMCDWSQMGGIGPALSKLKKKIFWGIFSMGVKILCQI